MSNVIPISRAPQFRPRSAGPRAARPFTRRSLDELQQLGQQMAEQFADRRVPENERTTTRETYTLRQFYEEWMLPGRLERIAEKQLSRGALSKDRQALQRWEALTRPSYKDWPRGRKWGGLPLGFITGRYLDRFLNEMRKKYAEATVYSTWSHLRTILNAAVRLRVLDRAPAPSKPPQPTGGNVEIYGTSVEPDGGLARAFRALAEMPVLQSAFVVAVNAGLRSRDLFMLGRDNCDLESERPALEFTASKTGKLQRIPLAQCTAQHLRRALRFSSTEFVFARLTNVNCEDPEKSREARHRNAITKELLGRAGLQFKKPWQAARATCNERLESRHLGVGQFVLGHALQGVNVRSYRQPSALIFEIVTSLPQPDCFKLDEGGAR